MVRWPVEKAMFIYTRPPGKCGIARITAESIVNSKPASEEGFDRIAFIILSVILKSMIFYNK